MDFYRCILHLYNLVLFHTLDFTKECYKNIYFENCEQYACNEKRFYTAFMEYSYSVLVYCCFIRHFIKYATIID